jgi:ATPase subunit of ABC transporter with duplicated ATPase domains
VHLSTVLTVQDVHKHFGNRRVLQGVSFALDDRDRVGMIGANGSGKSTLLKMVARGAGITEAETAARSRGSATCRSSTSRRSPGST